MNLESNMSENFKIPVNPAQVYGEEWKGWDDLFGTIKKWNKEDVLKFLLILEKDLETLDSYEILRIVEQSESKGLLQKNANLKELLDSEAGSSQRKDNISLLKKDFGFIEKEEEQNSEEKKQDLTEILKEETIINETQISKSSQEIEIQDKQRNLLSLKAFDNNSINTCVDHETIMLLLKYRLDKFWNNIMSKNYDIDFLLNETGGEYFTIAKNEFLSEYYKAINLVLPLDYEFKDSLGDLAAPNLMQRLISVRLSQHKQYGNWSSMGAGKTLSGVLAGRINNLKNTLIITFNANVEDWERTIKNAFPKNSNIICKQKKYQLKNDKYNYIVYNYETFQQENLEEILQNIINSNIEYIILDEVQLIKQREEEDFSKRKKIVESLVKSIDCKNKKRKIETYKLFMSATPIINNLMEPKKILELLKGVKFAELSTKPSVNNALEINKHLFLNGIRFIPNYDIEMEVCYFNINGNHLIHTYNLISQEEILKIERLFIPDKLFSIRNSLKRGTIIYTHYVTGIIEPIQQFVEMCGFSCGVYTGTNKTGLESFKNNDTDILICSSPISTGVDGLQNLSDQIIILNLPWTNAEYENLLGRIKRQGSRFKSIKIIIPQIEFKLLDKTYSHDINRLNCVNNKKTLSNIVLDAIIPSHLIKSHKELIAEAKQNFHKWIHRIEKEGLIQINREKLLMCIDDENIEVEQKPVRVLDKNTQLEIKIIKELEKINQNLHVTPEEGMPQKSYLSQHVKEVMTKQDNSNKFPIKIGNMTIYAKSNDPEEIERLRQKYNNF
jgi:hypothetical protein